MSVPTPRKGPREMDGASADKRRVVRACMSARPDDTGYDLVAHGASCSLVTDAALVDGQASKGNNAQ